MKQITGKDGFFNSKIAFGLGAKSKRNLFIMDYDGANKRQLTKHSALVMSPLRSVFVCAFVEGWFTMTETAISKLGANSGCIGTRISLVPFFNSTKR